MLQFLLVIWTILVINVVFSCYRLSLILFLIFHVPELFLFLLSLEDNHYADKTLVYKVVSYN